MKVFLPGHGIAGNDGPCHEIGQLLALQSMQHLDQHGGAEPSASCFQKFVPVLCFVSRLCRKLASELEALHELASDAPKSGI